MSKIHFNKCLLSYVAAALFLGACAQTSRPGSVGVERKQFMLISAAEVDQLSATAYADQARKAKQKNILITDGPQYERLKKIANRLIPQTGIFRDGTRSWILTYCPTHQSLLK